MLTETGERGGPQMRRFSIGMLVVLAACSSGKSFSEISHSHTITGTLSAPQCGGGYDIINANVEVRNENDTLIGSATTVKKADVGGQCTVGFTIPEVPQAKFYSIKIGSHSGPNYSFDQMQQNNWTVDLSLGG
jgi:hypothetical protein